MAKPKKPPLVDPAAMTGRATIRLRGGVYEIRTKSELSALDLSGLGHRLARIGELQTLANENSDAVTDADRQEYSDLLTLVCRRVVNAPESALSSMDEADKQYAVNRFFADFQQAIGRLLEAGNGKTRPIGTASSRS